MKTVLYEVSDHVATLTLNRPESMNSVNPVLIHAMLEASSCAASDPEVRAVIVRGAGKNFMAGGDLKWFRQQTALSAEDCRARIGDLIGSVQTLALNFKRMNKPVIIALHGAVAGFGLSLMMAADLALASENTYFTMAYSNIALSPDGGATWSLPRLAGLKRAMAIALLGDRFDAVHACELGLINRVVRPEELDDEAMKLARRLAAGPSEALARTKALLNRSFDNSFEAQLLAEQHFFVDCSTHPDFVEGLTAFLDKRKPLYGKN